MLLYREFVADSIIQAIATVEFEDGLRTHMWDGSSSWRLLGPFEWPHLAQDQFQTPLGVRVGPGGGVVVIGTLLSDRIPNSAEIPTSVVLNHSCYVVLG